MTWKANRLALRQGSLFPLCASAVVGVVIMTPILVVFWRSFTTGRLGFDVGLIGPPLRDCRAGNCHCCQQAGKRQCAPNTQTARVFHSCPEYLHVIPPMVNLLFD